MTERALDVVGFRQLMEAVARAWESGDVESGLACFTPDAVYMEPPDIQLFVGHEQLRPYFAAVSPGTFMRWHALWFDAEAQSGAGEYTFGAEGQPSADNGMCAVTLRDGRIASWREYQVKGSADRREFVATDGKIWQWHAGNYP
jgi:ketosteroid isomerase-like protein